MALASGVVRVPIRFAGRRRRGPPRPIWSAWWVTLLGLLFAIGVAVPVLTGGDRPMLARWEWIVTAVAAGLWTMLAIGLYRGVRVRKDEPLPDVGSVAASDSWGDATNVDVSPPFELGDDLIGGIVGLLLWIVVAIALIAFLPVILNGLLYAIVLIVAALAWIARRALRIVFSRGPRCRGRLGRSLTYASGYTLLYAGWLLGVLMLVDLVR